MVPVGNGEIEGGGAGVSGPWTIEEYVTASGKNLALRFLSGLTRQDKAEAIALLKLLGERGNKLGMPHSKALGRGLLELRGEARGPAVLHVPPRPPDRALGRDGEEAGRHSTGRAGQAPGLRGGPEGERG